MSWKCFSRAILRKFMCCSLWYILTLVLVFRYFHSPIAILVDYCLTFIRSFMSIEQTLPYTSPTRVIVLANPLVGMPVHLGYSNSSHPVITLSSRYRVSENRWLPLVWVEPTTFRTRGKHVTLWPSRRFINRLSVNEWIYVNLST